MSHKESKPQFTIVAFRYNRKRSIIYKNSTSAKRIGELVEVALAFHTADIISIRRVYPKYPKEKV